MANDTGMNIFKPEDYDKIKAELDRTTSLESEIKKANRAGIDTGDALEQNKDNRVRLVKIIQVYFPDKVGG